MGKLQVTTTLPETECTRQDIYDLVEGVNPTVNLVNTDVLNVLGAKITAGDRLPFWRKFTFAHTVFQAAATSNSTTLFQLPAGGTLHGVKVKHSTAFAGTGITDYKLNVGVAGTPKKYVGDFDVDSAVSATNLVVVRAPFWASLLPPAFVNADNAISSLAIGAAYNQGEVQALRAACEVLADDCRALRAALAALYAGAPGAESFTSATTLQVQAVSTGANLNASTAGAVDIWALYSVEV